MPYHQIYGYSVRANCPIPGVPVVTLSPKNQAEIEIIFGKLPSLLQDQTLQKYYVSSTYTEQGQPNLQVWHFNQGAYFKLLYGDETTFLLQRTPPKIWATWPDSLTLEDTTTYLLGPVLAFTLRLQGKTCLHASAVEVQQKVLAFVGRAGAGKSTTAAAFAQGGYPILSDDVVVLCPQQESWFVPPAYPRLRLWSDSVQFLYGYPERLPRIVPTHPTWDKRYLDLMQEGYQFSTHPLPLKRIYLLQPRRSDLQQPHLERLSPAVALVQLIANTSTNYLLDPKMRQQEFHTLSQLVQVIPVYQLTFPADSENFPSWVQDCIHQC